MAPRTGIHSTEAVQRIEAHMLPFHVEHDGPAAVSEWFVPLITKASSDNPHSVASFRGRELRGSPVGVSSVGASVYLLRRREEEHDSSNPPAKRARRATDHDGEVEVWNPVAELAPLIYWNHDDAPSACDDVPQLLAYMRLNAALHASVRVENTGPVVHVLED
eukprot:gnl/TRDRNA2_/TRDRNA2_44457_c0_seq1.p1 gnl/TRDRNA2_/TRDRNA2_44457_c0~~gnl/TRDRNA2_/TRDRNA2_44457_c0_seq1.p1  ORF type:complete len:178 (-),score=29.06 gnl/TRDRNA2_/TRDRNA2_44457_c0_seq1:171-659(-)